MSGQQEAKPTVQQIGSALQVLFGHGNSSEARKQANELLELFQRTPEAWQLADQLLRTRDANASWQTHCLVFGSFVLVGYLAAPCSAFGWRVFARTRQPWESGQVLAMKYFLVSFSRRLLAADSLVVLLSARAVANVVAVCARGQRSDASGGAGRRCASAVLQVLRRCS
jgi:hypothetical protein